MIEHIVKQYLENSSMEHIKEIHAHGIHNLTNEFNRPNVYELYDEEFKLQAHISILTDLQNWLT